MCVFLEIPVFQGLFLRILWSKVMNNDDISKISIFLGVEMFKFHVVGELSFWGLQTGINVSNFISFCYWNGVKFMGKWIHNLHILGKFLGASSMHFCLN